MEINPPNNFFFFFFFFFFFAENLLVFSLALFLSPFVAVAWPVWILVGLQLAYPLPEMIDFKQIQI